MEDKCSQGVDGWREAVANKMTQGWSDVGALRLLASSSSSSAHLDIRVFTKTK